MRFEHWPVRLNAIIGKYMRRPHEWGTFDCMTFVADCVWAVTQKDPGEGFRYTYNTRNDGLRIVVAAGGLEEFVDSRLAAVGIQTERINPNFAQRGDVCLLAGLGFDGGPQLGICYGEHVLAKALDGVDRFPISAANVCWAIR